MFSRRWLFTVSCVAALALSACSGDDDPKVGVGGDTGSNEQDTGMVEDAGGTVDLGGAPDLGSDMGPQDMGSTDQGTADLGGGGDDVGVDVGMDLGVGEPATGELVFPQNTRVATTHAEIVLRGTTSGPATGVDYGGIAATSTDNFATWEVRLPLDEGVNQFTGLVLNAQGNAEPLPNLSVTRLVPFNGGYGADVDTTTGRIYTVDVRAPQVYRIDPSNAELTVAVDLADFVTATDTNSPVDIAVDSANQALYVPSRVPTATRPMGIWRYDLQAGTWSEISTDARGTGPSIVAPGAVALNAAGDTLYMAESPNQHILAIDIATGNRTILASDTVPAGQTVDIGVMMDIAFDAGTNQLLVADRTGSSLFGIDPTTGAGTYISSATQGTGPDLASVRAMGLDSSGGRAFIFSLTTPRQLIEIDLTTGNRTEIPNPQINDARSLIYDSTNDVIHAVEPPSQTATTTNLQTGMKAILIGNGFPNLNGVPRLRGCAQLGHEVWTHTADTLLRLNNVNQLMPIAGQGTANPLNGTIRAIASTSGVPVLYVLVDLDAGGHELIAYDTSTNTPTTLVSQNATEDNRLSGIGAMELSGSGDTLYAMTKGASDILYAVDTTTGNVTKLSDNTVISAVDFDNVTDLTWYNQSLFAADSGLDKLIRIDPVTGVRSESMLPRPPFVEIVHTDADGNLWFTGFDPNDAIYKLAPGDTSVTAVLNDMTPLGYVAQDVPPYWLEGDLEYITCTDVGILEFDPETGATVILTR